VEVDIFSPLRFSIQEEKNLLKVFAISIGRRHPTCTIIVVLQKHIPTTTLKWVY
jgi:hypothetical protein